jgi:hypothetical protein
MSDIFLPEDCVFYVGDNERIKSELTSKEGKPSIGYIHAPVENQEGVFVVEFPEVKGCPSYLMRAENLTHKRPSKTEKVDGPEVQARRSRKRDADTE